MSITTYFNCLLKHINRNRKKKKPSLGHLTEKDFIWFDYHEQARTIKGLTPEQFVERILIQNSQHSIGQELERQNIFTYIDGATTSVQKGVLRINCIDCLDRTNNVQLTLGMVMLKMQMNYLKRGNFVDKLMNNLRDMWINNGDNISRIYTGTGALGQRNKVNYFFIC